MADIAPVADVVEDLPAGLKAGWKSTEFWVTIAMIGGAGVLFWKGKDDLATALLSLAGVKYSITRTILKLKHGDSA